MNAGQGFHEVTPHLEKVGVGRHISATDQNIVPSITAMLRQFQSRDLAQPSLCAIAGHRVADLL